MLPLLRIAIVVIAALELYWFSGGLELAFEILADPVGTKWFDLLSAFAVGVVAPLCALAAAGLAIANRRPGLAAIMLCIAPLSYMAPSIAFAIAVMIYGF